MSFTGFWKNVGKGFAKTGVGAIKVATWASEHPEVLSIVAQVIQK